MTRLVYRQYTHEPALGKLKENHKHLTRIADLNLDTYKPKTNYYPLIQTLSITTLGKCESGQDRIKKFECNDHSTTNKSITYKPKKATSTKRNFYNEKKA